MQTKKFMREQTHVIFLALNIFAVALLYVYFFHIEAWTSWLSLIVSAIPGFLVGLIGLSVLLTGMANETAKVFLKILGSLIITLIAYKIYGDKIKTWVEEAQRTFYVVILLVIFFSSVGLFLKKKAA